MQLKSYPSKPSITLLLQVALFIVITSHALLHLNPFEQELQLKGDVCLSAVDVNDLVFGQTSSSFSQPRKPFHPWQASIHLRVTALFVSVLSHLLGTAVILIIIVHRNYSNLKRSDEAHLRMNGHTLHTGKTSTAANGVRCFPGGAGRKST